MPANVALWFSRLAYPAAIVLVLFAAIPIHGGREGRAPRQIAGNTLSDETARFVEGRQRPAHARPETSWWPEADAVGLGTWEHVPTAHLDSPFTLILPNGKGSIDVRDAASPRRHLPASLRNPASGSRYAIAQLTPEAASGQDATATRALFARLGVRVMDYVPNNAYLVRLSAGGIHRLAAAREIQFSMEFEPADKVSPSLGRKSRLNPHDAASDIFHLVIELFDEEDPAAVAGEIARLGGDVTHTQEVAGTTYVSASLRNARVLELARHQAIRHIAEAPEYVTLNLVSSAQLEIGRWLDPRDFGDFILPFRAAGVDGGGLYGGALPNYADPAPAGALAIDPALFTIPPQFLGVADNGLTLDSPAFANDNTHPCLGPGVCLGSGSALTNVGSTHRKVEAYFKGTLLDPTSSGDFLTCDAIDSGGHTHGTIAAGGAAANPSGGPIGLGRSYEDVDALDQFTTFFNDSRETGLSLDGQARGARVIFQDIALTPASSPPACATNYLSDIDAGDVPAGRLEEMVYRRDLAAGNTTPHPRGAKVTLFAFGSPVNFDDDRSAGNGNYAGGAASVDAFLFANRHVLHVQAVGNDGAYAGGSDIDPFAPFDPNVCPTGCLDPTDIQINDLATGKNLVTVGANHTDSISPSSLFANLDPSEFIANFTSKGPATYASLRVAPLLVAPGFDTGDWREGKRQDDYFISSAQVVSFDNANDTAGVAPVENFVVQGEAGTSVAAAKIAGAALQIRDYFARGFYREASANAAESVPDISGMLVKALLVNSTDFASQGPLIASCTGRFCNEQGYGKVELANTLPLNTYRAERRPPGLSNVAPVTNVPQGLVVADEYFDGGMRGAAPDGSLSGLGVVPVGGSVSFDLYRRHGNDQMRISLAWYDAVGELLRNDLNLEVTSGDYDITVGGAGICGASGGATPELCGYCTHAANEPGSGGYYDPTGNNPYIYRWHGNQFFGFGNQFSQRIECDSATGLPDSDLVGYPQNATDSRNPTESVMLHYFGDPLFFGASRGGGDHGFYRVRVRFPAGAPTVPVPHAPAIAAGPNAVLNTTPAGDDTIQMTGSGLTYIGAGPDGIANTTKSGDDLQLIPSGSYGQPFGLAVAGPVFTDRVSSVISLNRDVYDCSERVLSLRVAEGSRIPANANQAETPARVGAGLRVETYDAAGTPRDLEAGFTATIDAGSAAFRVGRATHFNSNGRRVQFMGGAAAGAPIHNNGIVEVSDGWTIRATYDDPSATTPPGGPVPADAVTEARVICRPMLGEALLALEQENHRRSVVTGGCDIGRVAGSRGDLFLDAGESVVYSVGFANQSMAQPINLRATLSCVDPIPGGADPCAHLTLPHPEVELGAVPPGREGIASWPITIGAGVTSLATADRAVDLTVTFASRGTDFGGTLASQTFTFREALQADLEILRYNTDFPLGGTQAADRNRDGLITTIAAGATARNRELATYQPLNNVGNPNIAAAAQMPWHFDSSNGGFTARRAGDSKPGPSPQNSLAWYYSTAGGCGWQTRNDGANGSGGSVARGIWHAGHGPILGWGTANACPGFSPPSDPSTPYGMEFYRDVLRSPVLAKVNTGLDARGMPFDLRMEGLGFNDDFCASIGTQATVEMDADVDDSGPVILGDSFTYRVLHSRSGGYASPANRARFGPLFDSDGAGPPSGRNQIGFSGCPTPTATTAFPAQDGDPLADGFQPVGGTDPATGLPIIPGICTAGLCVSGADALIGTGCATDGQCAGPGTRLGHSTPWGPVRSTEIDPGGSYEDFYGRAGNRFQFELGWTVGETALGGPGGWTIDDPYMEWSEQHPADQAASGVNDCANIPSRPGADPSARQCATLTLERLSIHTCTGSLRATLIDSTPAPPPAGSGCGAGQVAVVAATDHEPGGEYFCLAGMGGGVYEGAVRLSGLSDQPGILFVGATGSASRRLVVSYRDEECDQDGDGELGENDFLDLDGDGVPNTIDLCFSGASLSDVFNAPGVPQRDNDGSGTVTAADCPIVGAPHGRSPVTGQCDWDADARGDLCDNCPAIYNAAQSDSDGDGVGDDCEATDIDGDSVPNESDNCPTLYNPSQLVANPGDLRGIFCDRTQDSDGDGVDEINDNCPNETSGLEQGVPAPSAAETYNPGQEDRDGDGIGDRCDVEDLDFDTLAYDDDNCPTLYNPPDPLTGRQTDSDGDGLGDDRTGIDTQPGVQDYCDPGSDDDTDTGLPDDLLQVAASLDCDFSSQGTGRVTGLAPSTASLALGAVAMADDGTADFLCTAGDPNPLNDPALPEPCPQEMPGGPSQDASCDTPGMPGSGICAAVPDGIADPGETTTLRLTLTNTTVDPRTGIGMSLTNLAVGIRSLSPAVGCIPKSHVFIPNLGDGGTVVTSIGALSAVVDPAPGGAGQWGSMTLPQPEAHFELTATADGIEGLSSSPTFRFFTDRDITEAPPIPGACSENILINGPGVLCEGFDTDRNNDGDFDFTRLPIGASPTDPLRALGDPGDDVLGYTQDTGVGPTGTAGRTCPGYLNRPYCQAPVAEENDWHLHSPYEGPGAGYDPLNLPGIGAPDGGKAHRGFRSMHMGRHLDPTTTIFDTTRYRQVSAFVLDSQGDTNDGLALGLGTTMEFWHMIETHADPGGFGGPGAGSFGGGQVHISLMGFDGTFERWRRLAPTVNGYDWIINSTISICEFDPGDDELAPADETMCRAGSPLWTDIGDIFGTDATCVTDTDANDPANKDCGRTTTRGPANIQNGSIGLGVWARSAFDLSPFGGRVARLRWIFMEGGGWSFGTTRSALEPEPGNAIYQYFDGDDGWWIDDIVLTDLRQAPATLGPDPLNGLSICPTGADPDACGVISISVAGTPLISDTPGQPVAINLLPSSAGDDPGTTITIEGGCSNGMLVHQISEMDGAGAVADIILPLSPRAVATVAPWRDTTYRIETHCSSDPECMATADYLLLVYPGDGSDLDLEASGGTTTTLSWLARPQPAGISGYDLFRLTFGPFAGGDPFSGGTFDGACFANAVAQAQVGTLKTTTDTAVPALNTSFMYQLGHSSAAAGALAPLGIGPPASLHAGQVLTSGVACP